MKPPGIFDPYTLPKPKKKDQRSPMDMEAPYDTEYAEPREISNIALDGDTYVVEFLDATIEDIPKRLGELINDVHKKHRDTLVHFGVTIFPPGETPPEDPDMLFLPTPSGTVGVHVGVEKIKDEVTAYRRLGYALSRIAIADILKKNNTKIYTR